MKRRIRLATVSLAAALVLAGCAGNQKLMLQKDKEIQGLRGDVTRLQGDLRTEQEKSRRLGGDLEKALADVKAKDQLLVEHKGALARVSVSESALFASGSTQLTAAGREVLDGVAGVIVKYPDHEVMIEGHTDNVPIGPRLQDRFRSNWELSAARSLAVLHYLRDKHKIDPKRLAVVGYGEYRPVAENSTPAGRAKNRRVVIAIMKPL